MQNYLSGSKSKNMPLKEGPIVSIESTQIDSGEIVPIELAQIGMMMLTLFLWEGFVFLEVDAFVEGLGAVGAFGEEVEADATNVFLGLEVLEVVDEVALDFKFHHAPVLYAHLVAIAKVSVHNFCHADHDTFDDCFIIRMIFSSFLV